MLRVFFNSFKNNGILCKKIKNSIFKNNFSNGFLDSIYIDDKEENDLLHMLPLNRNKVKSENKERENKKNENKERENKKNEN